MAYIEIGGQVNGMFRRNIIVELDKKDEAIKRNNFTDTYSTIYQYDNKRLFREPNSINSKTGYYKVQLTLSDLKAMSYEDLIKYASKPRDLLEVDKTFNKQARQAFDSFIEQAKEKQKRSINYNVARTMLVNKELLPCVKYILANGAVKGGRNNTAMALASALLQREMNEQKVLEIMKE